MNPDQTNPDFELTRLLHRCDCGNDVMLEQQVGGICDVCDKTIPAPKATFDNSVTVAISDYHGDIETANEPFVNADDNFEVVGVDPLIGQYFGHFKLINRIGRGGMGYVYRAVDTSLKRFVAVKVLKSGTGWTNNTSTDQEVELLLQEAVSQARVNHPNVVTIFFVGKQNDEPFLAMELVQGQPLSERIKSQPLSFPKIVGLGLQIADALKFAQRLDIIHGDIKPSNLLVQENDTVKLSDFGMARRESKATDSTHGGTPNYLAPELIEGGETSVQSDIYALGVTLYEMTFGVLPVKLTGRKPVDWTADHYRNLVAYPTPWPEHLPENWKSMLGRMLHKDPTQRYQNYDELIDDLKTVEALSTIQAKRVPRLLAGVFDFLSVLLVAAAIQFLLFDVLRLRDYTDNLAILFLISLADLLPILLYSAIVFFFRQSVGRNLLYLRVVNQYGVPPSRRIMLTRSFVRMGFVWLLIASMVFEAQDANWTESMQNVLAWFAIGLLVVQILVLMFNRNHRTIQDMVYKTDVVFDT
jgi:serine/threonine protein kinase